MTEERISSITLTAIVPVYNERHLIAASLKRLLKVQSPYISSLEVIVVDDHSTDGSWEVLQELAVCEPRIHLLRHEKNLGKGAAIQTALQRAKGEACIVHDADMEYNPEDIPSLVHPLIAEGAEAVFGSRYLSASYRRVLMYRHSMINKGITAVVNWVTDLDLTDVETCYKLIKTRLFKTLPLRYNDFRFEVEVTMKLAKRRVRIFEVPIRYLPRSYEEGKKIRMRDGFLAIAAIFRFLIIEDLFDRKTAFGLQTLLDLSNARRFNKWMANALRPYLGNRVLEIGAGIGNLTNQFIPRDFYVSSDIETNALDYLSSFSIGKPYMKVAKINAELASDFAPFPETFDTVVMVNVLEHLPNEQTVLKNIYDVLIPGGKAVILVPQHPWLFGSYDRLLSHQRRYTRKTLQTALLLSGFEMEKIFDFNRVTVFPWLLNNVILKRKRFSLVQIKLMEIFMPLIRRVDRFLPWSGLSLIAVARKPNSSS